jgi:hypothetical protein
VTPENKKRSHTQGASRKYGRWAEQRNARRKGKNDKEAQRVERDSERGRQANVENGKTSGGAKKRPSD